MKITKQTLKQLIKEELDNLLLERDINKMLDFAGVYALVQKYVGPRNRKAVYSVTGKVDFMKGGHLTINIPGELPFEPREGRGQELPGEAALSENDAESWDAARSGDKHRMRTLIDKNKPVEAGIGPSDDPLRANYNREKSELVSKIIADIRSLMMPAGAVGQPGDSPEARLARPDIMRLKRELKTIIDQEDPNPSSRF